MVNADLPTPPPPTTTNLYSLSMVFTNLCRATNFLKIKQENELNKQLNHLKLDELKSNTNKFFLFVNVLLGTVVLLIIAFNFIVDKFSRTIEKNRLGD